MTPSDTDATASLGRIRLLATDIDGTLLTPNHRVLPVVGEAFSSARAAGLTIVLASARSPGALKGILEELGHAGPCICFSGAWVGTIDPTAASAVVDRETTIEPQTARAVASAAIASGLVPSWHSDRHWTVNRMSAAVEREMRVTGQVPRVVSDFADVSPPNKILLIGDRDLLIQLRREFARSFGTAIDAVFSHANYLEIMPKGVSKDRALLELASRRGIQPDEVAAVGDAENDLGMIRAAGFGVAMGNATDEVRSTADWITRTNIEGGVATLIRKLLDARDQ